MTYLQLMDLDNPTEIVVYYLLIEGMTYHVLGISNYFVSCPWIS